jgi:uncharacterized protein (UPF0335 family)
MRRSKKMTDGDNKELIEVLKRIEKQLGDIKFDLADIKREMPKVPFYGDLLQDIVKAIENIRK